jgi:DnaJ-class molecular chaperone
MPSNTRNQLGDFPDDGSCSRCLGHGYDPWDRSLDCWMCDGTGDADE